MKYKILDLQLGRREFGDGAIFEDKEEVVDQLASYHDIDYEGEKPDNKPYKDIYEFLNTLPTIDDRLDWLLDYGDWEIVEV